ncbi:hypothetical protein B9Z55_013976 [Caenorhabditis nigoni]|uniref:Uncharacterized protein n=1 Tax=Caenorhabditis nigoni TaxID=1611254 RepID=A0A2G5U401_9PELO|nr:hypothetical protein B9Z55_013976 [Caenorhabditis nigoni]
MNTGHHFLKLLIFEIEVNFVFNSNKTVFQKFAKFHEIVGNLVCYLFFQMLLKILELKTPCVFLNYLIDFTTYRCLNLLCLNCCLLKKLKSNFTGD